MQVTEDGCLFKNCATILLHLPEFFTAKKANKERTTVNRYDKSKI